MGTLILNVDAISPDFWQVTELCRFLEMNKSQSLLHDSPSQLNPTQVQKWREKIEYCDSIDHLHMCVLSVDGMGTSDWFAVICASLHANWCMSELFSMMLEV
jgi:hypothetical protein